MYSRISIALIVVGLLVAGFGIFNNAVTRAAPPCVTYNSATLAANPELMIVGRYTVPIIKHNQTSGSEFYVANPELMAVHRYAAAATEK